MVKWWQWLILALFILPASAADPGVYGVSWSSANSSPTIQRIDSDGNPVAMSSADFNTIPPWSLMKRCVVSQNGSIYYGSNNRGDGLDLNGSDGPVMVEIPKFGVNMTRSGAVTTLLISANVSDKYPIHPAFYQRGDLATPNLTRNFIYVGSYDAVLKVNSSGVLMTSSFTGQQPWTGYATNTSDGMFALGFANSGVAPIKGAFINGTSSGKYGILVDNVTSSGFYEAGTGTGTLYLKQTTNGTATSLFTAGETLTQNGVVFGIVDATQGNEGIRFGLNNATVWSSSRGSQYGVINIFSYSAFQQLFLVEMGSLDSQSILGRGITNKALGQGFNGEINGFNSLDALVSAINSTGNGGLGTTGLNSTMYRGMADIWGNTNMAISAYFINSSSGNYTIAFHNGTSNLNQLAITEPFDYTVTNVPALTSTGFITNIDISSLSLNTFLPTAQGGSSSTYFSDRQTAYTSGYKTPIISGAWSVGTPGGLFYSDASASYTGSAKTAGSRLEFIPAATLPNFTSNVTSGAVSLPVQFTDTSSGSPTNWSWTFGDLGAGNTSTSQNPVHTYTTAGTYTVNLTINNTANPDRTITKTNYITVVPVGFPVPIFTANQTVVQIGDVVQFNQTSTGTTPMTFNWSFGDGSYSNVTNATHSYSTLGLKTVSLNVTNAVGSNTTTKTDYIDVTSSEFVQQDIWMSQQYLLTLHVTDVTTGAIIPVATFTDSTTLIPVTTTNGTFYLTYPFGALAGVVSATGYNSKVFSYFIDNDTEQTIQLTPTVANANQNTWWTPHTVQITVMSDSYGTRLPGVVIAARYNESSMPTDWLRDLYGIQSVPAADMINSTLILGGTTGSDGTLTSTMLGSIKYDISLNAAAYGLVNYNVSAYPSDPMLNIYVPVSGSTLPTSGNNTYSQLNSSRAYVLQPNISYMSECLDYQDSSGSTSSVTETWWYGNNGTVIQNVTFSPGTALVTNCYTSLNIRGTRIYWMANGTRSP